MDDLISIIVPIYQVEDYLEKCIQSIRRQTYNNLEIILVCKDSADRCSKICEYHAQRDRRIKIVWQKSSGLDPARKEGMLAAHGKYIGYVDGDDWIEPNMYEELLGYACKYSVDIVESGAIDSWEGRETKRTPFLDEGCYKDQEFVEKVEPKLLYAGVFFEHGISPYMWSKLFLKEKIFKYQMLGGIINTMYDDVMVSLPCIAETKSIYVSHKCYYHYRVRNESLKREYRKGEEIKLLRCYSDLYERFKSSSLCLKEDKQIDYFMLYSLLYRAPHIFDAPYGRNFLKAFGNIKIEDKIVLYGAGAVGIRLEQYIREIKDGNIVCWVDRNYKSFQGILNVVSPREILNYQYDYVIISIIRGHTAQSAIRELINMGVPEKKICWIKEEYIKNPKLLISKALHQNLSKM